MSALPFFEWLDTSLLADISKAYGGVFAVVQMFHLLALSLLGGTVLVGDLRLLGVVMKDVPSQVVIDSTQKWFSVALVVLIASGVFMASAVAMKVYYNEMFWAKMTALATGISIPRLARCRQGNVLFSCSNSEITTLSPTAQGNPWATMFTPSEVFLISAMQSFGAPNVSAT